jgi:hypothetical protein
VLDFDLLVHARAPVGCSPVESCQVYPVQFTVRAVDEEPGPAWTPTHTLASGTWAGALAAAGAGAWVAVRRAATVVINGGLVHHPRNP